MTEKEAQLIVNAALRCGALSAEASCGVVKITFQAIDYLLTEFCFAAVVVSERGLSISEMRSSRTPAAITWERQFADVLGSLDELRMNISQHVAA